MSQKLFDQVQAWIADDPDPVTAAELSSFLAAALATQSPDGTDVEVNQMALAELQDRFSGLLQFGTAGLRGAMAGGPNRMNRAVVIRAAAGLTAYLKQALPGERPRLIIGYDARHNSYAFAIDTAAVAAAAGLEVHVLAEAWPTPVTAFALLHLDADAAVMVTASHNPAQDNGYKVYLGGRVVGDSGRGAQIVPPVDTLIAQQIAAVESVRSIPRDTRGWQRLGREVWEAYCVAAGRIVNPRGPRNIRLVHTALHGVGSATALQVLHDAGFTDVHPVTAQQHPDPDFPTVSFPNPEEPGAIDLALELAREVSADAVIAHDPDADRVAIAIPDPRVADPAADSPAHQAGWRMLHGDEVGALLGEMIAADRSRLRIAPGALVFANSIVSSRLLAAITKHYGHGHVTTLTGFKWIARVPGLVFGYEEALGYCVDPTLVHDKDGISAGLLLAQLIAQLKADGRTVIDALDDLVRRHGLYLTSQVSARFSDLSQIAAAVDSLAATPPQELLGSPVTEATDLSLGYQGLAPTPGVLLTTASGTRVIVRPSGTEPKIKAYLETITPASPNASYTELTALRQRAGLQMESLAAEVSAGLGL